MFNRFWITPLYEEPNDKGGNTPQPEEKEEWQKEIEKLTERLATMQTMLDNSTDPKRIETLETTIQDQQRQINKLRAKLKKSAPPTSTADPKPKPNGEVDGPKDESEERKQKRNWV